MLTWDQYFANHPEVLASWGQQNGRRPTCTCPVCKDHHDFLNDPGRVLTVADIASTAPPPAVAHSRAALAPLADLIPNPGSNMDRVELYRRALGSALAAGRGVALHAVLAQMRDDGQQGMAVQVERTLARALVDAAREDPAIMAELLDLVRRAYPETPAGAAGGNTQP